MRQLQTFYWLPKMHKNPIGSRFIAVSSASEGWVRTAVYCTRGAPYTRLVTLLTINASQYCGGDA